MISVREIAGWVLVVAAFFILNFAWEQIQIMKTIEGGLAAGVAMVVFRGGIHLIKAATAARIALKVHPRQVEQPLEN